MCAALSGRPGGYHQRSDILFNAGGIAAFKLGIC